jgi:hypothetical protein
MNYAHRGCEIDLQRRAVTSSTQCGDDRNTGAIAYAWIALALLRDPLHVQAREQWDMLHDAGAKLHTSVPVVIETFTFLERNADRDVALAWKDGVHEGAEY